MKFFSVIIFALFMICCSVGVQAQQPCPVACPALYRPTCGFNGRCHKQFVNDCQMSHTNCSEKQNFQVVDLAKCSQKGLAQC
ncbi:U-Kazal-Dg21.2 [Calliphora vicina]|uniref:U-Kazal-Dg21.2 n=1 Tax=Calliphora vicina TaxID=7373 RepID=UPI00325C1FE1